MAQTTTDLVHRGSAVSVDRVGLMQSCKLFVRHPALLEAPWHGSAPRLTHENCPALKLLCDEFEFTRLGGDVEAFTDRWTSVVFAAETVHILRDTLARTCVKFRDCPSLLTRPYRVTSSIGADVFHAVVTALNGAIPALTNENVTDIGLLCEEFGYDKLSATVAEFLAHHSSPGERACREIVALKAQNAALAAQVAHLTAQSSREIALLQVVAVKLFGAERFLAQTVKVALETNADQIGEMIGKFYPEMTWDQELDAIQKCSPASPVDEAIAVVQRRFPDLKVGQLPPSLKKGRIPVDEGWGNNKRTVQKEIDVPDGIIAHLTRECGGNVHERHVVDVTSGSFEKETLGVNPHSAAYDDARKCAAKNAADLETGSCFLSAYRRKDEAIPHTRNNWVRCDFGERRIVPTHYTIRANGCDPGDAHLKSWLVETSGDGETWREVAREEDNWQLNGSRFTGTFAVAGGGECRFIRLVNIGENHRGNDCLTISAWEIFGILIE